MNESKYLTALRLVLEELSSPSRDLRIAASAMDCKGEMYSICEWLSKEVEKEIQLSTMFDEVG